MTLISDFPFAFNMSTAGKNHRVFRDTVRHSTTRIFIVNRDVLSIARAQYRLARNVTAEKITFANNNIHIRTHIFLYTRDTSGK